MAATDNSIVIERVLTQDDFNAFAKLSGDDNPIHVDPVFSARTSFGRTVSHGMLLYSILRGLVEKLAPGAQQLSQDLMFPAPAYADEPLRFEVVASKEEGTRRYFDMRAERVADGACVCEASAMFKAEAAT